MCRLARWRFQIFARGAAHLQNLHPHIDENAGWRVFRQEDSIAFFLRVEHKSLSRPFPRKSQWGPLRGEFVGGEAEVDAGRRRSLCINLVLLIYWNKQVRIRADRFRQP